MQNRGRKMYEKIKEYSLLAFFVLLFSAIIYGAGYFFGARGKQEQLENENSRLIKELDELGLSFQRLEDRNRELVYRLGDATATAHRITDTIEQAIERARTIADSRARIDVLLGAIENAIGELKTEFGDITEINRERAIEE
jgi:DNA repair exonuclease SbcCD ATPase subunit